jgi:hypothetical protein
MVLVAMSMGLVGCGESRDPALVGTWEMDTSAMAPEMPQMPEGADDEFGGMAAGMAEMMGEQLDVTMTLNEDGTWTSRVTVAGQARTSRGTWTTSGGDTLTLTATEGPDGEAPSDDDATTTGSYTATTITMTDDAGEEVTFTKQ